MKTRFTWLAVAALLASGAFAQSRGQHAAAITPVGVWRGTSTCLVRQSACNDEIAVYRIAQGNTADSVMIDGRKVVNGKELQMGVLPCRFAAKTGLLTCLLPQGNWLFRLHGDSLTGELRHPDGTKFRDVRTTRVRP